MEGKEGQFFNPESFEKGKFHYSFSDNKMLGHPVFFECDANDDLEADEKLAFYIKENDIDTSESEIIRSVISN